MRWWYGSGWLDQVRQVRDRFDNAADFFSLELALRTLFKPFRQIDADRARKGSISVIMRGVFDQLFSRFIGAMIRLVLIVIGCVVIALEAVVGVLRLLFWPVVPFLPLLALPLVMTGWLPWL